MLSSIPTKKQGGSPHDCGLKGCKFKLLSCFYIHFWTNHHHHVVLQAQISLTLSRHFSLSFIASGRSSEPHPVSSNSCWMYVWADCPAFAQPYVGVHRSTSLMSSSLLLQHSFSYELNGTTTFFQQERLWHWITHKGWYVIKQINQTI